MALHYLIRDPDTNEEMLVLDLRGHEHCVVLEEGVTPPKVPGCLRKEGKWRVFDKNTTRILSFENQDPRFMARRILELEERIAKAGIP